VSAEPLDGIRVVELAHVMAGPVCGLLLADLGAEVVKVERLPHGDATRGFVPPSLSGESAAFMMLNRGKRGIALNLRSAGGLDAVRRLLDRADVVIENFRPGTMESMGLGYEALTARRPGLVYCQVSGFGSTGPLGDQGGFDLIAQGYSGLMSITGEGPGREPVKVGAPVTDITAGILAALGVVAALLERQRTGLGRRVETSLFEAGIAQTFWQSAIALAGGGSPGPLGSAHPLAAPYQAFRTADGWVNVGASNERTWRALVTSLQAPGLGQDARFRTNSDRLANLDELVAVLAPRFASRTTAEWVDILRAVGVPAGPVLSIEEMLRHPQTVARGMVTEVEHATAGTVRTLGMPVKVGTPEPVRRGAPLLGQHTREVLRETGYSAEEVDDLVRSGAAYAG